MKIPGSSAAIARVMSDAIIHDRRRSDINHDARAIDAGTAGDDEAVHARVLAGIADRDYRALGAAVEDGDIQSKVALRTTRFSSIESAVHRHTGFQRHELGVRAAGDPKLVAGHSRRHCVRDGLLCQRPARAGRGIIAGGFDVESSALAGVGGQQQSRGYRDRPPQISNRDDRLLYHKRGIFTMVFVCSERAHSPLSKELAGGCYRLFFVFEFPCNYWLKPPPFR